MNESVGYFEACIFVTGNATDSISIIIESRENEAQGKLRDDAGTCWTLFKFCWI